MAYLRHRSGIRHAGGLDDDGVQLELASGGARGELLDDGDQVLPHAAADAAVERLDDLLVAVEGAATAYQRRWAGER